MKAREWFLASCNLTWITAEMQQNEQKHASRYAFFWHACQPSFSPLQLLQLDHRASFVPANISCDSTSPGNKCPSFTVCWLIYNNYTCLWAREDDQIVWDESIKSLLSEAISWLGVTITIRWACSEVEAYIGKAHLFPRKGDNTNITCTQTEAEKRAINSQTECLLRKHSD